MIAHEILAHYRAGKEEGRLKQRLGRLEYLRTLEILERYLPQPPARVLDVGGGTGAYAIPLAERGYEVHLIDAVPLHVERAREVANGKLAGIELGDARKLEHEDASFDVVLMFGPLYHLIEKSDRLAALREANRVLRWGGLLCAAYVSRFASACDGIQEGELRDPEFAKIVSRDLADGVHLNPTENPAWFTTAYFHHPAEIGPEIEEAGLGVDCVLAVEGPGWVNEDLDAWLDQDEERARLLDVLRKLEAEPSLIGASAHLLAVAHRKS